MTQLIRDASNWAFQLDLQHSKAVDFQTLIKSILYLISSFCLPFIHKFFSGAQIFRADQLKMLDEI